MPTITVTTDRVDKDGLSLCRVERLSDVELLASTRRLVGKSNQLLAALLAHLAEVESRGLHRSKACSSLYTYCIYELRFSEDAASRRVCAARLVKRLPALLEAIANGELHLTGLLMLGPYITPLNQLELLARAKFRTKKELAKLVRILDPLPDVPAQVVALGPARAPTTANPDWQNFAHSLCPPARELAPEDRPKNWVTEALADDDRIDTAARAREASRSVESLTAAPAREEPSSVLTVPQRYRVQFTAGEEYVWLIERAQALLSGGAGSCGGLAEIHLRGMRVLVAGLEKQKYGAARARVELADAEGAPQIVQSPPRPEATRRRVRRIPAAERRTVFERDGARCSYVDGRGQRCRETQCLELHHLVPFSREGAHVSANLALFCRAHNTLAAEEDFSRSFIETKRDEVPHILGGSKTDMRGVSLPRCLARAAHLRRR